MAIVNFWVIYEDAPSLDSVEDLLPAEYTLDGERRTHQKPAPGVQASLFKDVGAYKLRSLYTRYDDLSDIVDLREGLRALEEALPELYVVGMWNFSTGEPIGGAGSPWFQTPGWVGSHTPSGEVEDVVLLAGQVTRKFV